MGCNPALNHNCHHSFQSRELSLNAGVRRQKTKPDTKHREDARFSMKEEPCSRTRNSPQKLEGALAKHLTSANVNKVRKHLLFPERSV